MLFAVAGTDCAARRSRQNERDDGYDEAPCGVLNTTNGEIEDENVKLAWDSLEDSALESASFPVTTEALSKF